MREIGKGFLVLAGGLNGGRDRDRTCNPGLRRSVLYPIELLAPGWLLARGRWLPEVADAQGIGIR
jgi:hypothetical protein